MPEATVLVVEDEEDILELICYNLKREGFLTETAMTGEEAVKAIGHAIPDLVLLDVMLPRMNGLDVCRKLKNDPGTASVPVIMVTARGEESDIVAGLELGADDYITKPFKPRELVARARAVIRRSTRKKQDANATLTVFDLKIDPSRRQVKLAGNPVDLTYTEFQVLHFLCQRPGIVFTRYQIVDAVRGEDYAVTDRAVDVQIVGLRKKLGSASSYIETVRGVGYRFRDPGA